MTIIPCGKVTGHGESCVEDHMCDSCTIIERLVDAISTHKKRVTECQGDTPENLEKQGDADAHLWSILKERWLQ